MQPKPKKCKGIGKAHGFRGCGRLTVFRKYGLCSKCLSKWTNETKEGKEFLSRQVISAKRKIEKQKRSERRVEKQNAKTAAKLRQELQKEVNTIVRLIDADKSCISCNHGNGSEFTRQAHAGHYYSVGGHNSLRFNLHNIHRQCSICNNYLSGALTDYRRGLAKRYGSGYLAMVEGLKAKYPYIKLSRQEYEDALKKARKIIKEIKSGTDFTREEVNKRLGIYGT